MSTNLQVIEKATERLRELEEETERLRQFIRTYEELSGEKVVDKSGSVSTSAEDGDHASPAEIVESALAAIREHNRPLSRSRLVKILTAKGLKLPGTDKAKNVGTVIWRSKKFDNIAGWGYWPKGAPTWAGQKNAETQFALS